ncbi:MAG: hypothetical protein ACT4NX_00955 [Deltaproteobacteria bacterium]
MLKRFAKPTETREYNFVITRSGYDLSGLGVTDRKAINAYVDTLKHDIELIPVGADRVIVNLRETEDSMHCEVLPVFSKN